MTELKYFDFVSVFNLQKIRAFRLHLARNLCRRFHIFFIY